MKMKFKKGQQRMAILVLPLMLLVGWYVWYDMIKLPQLKEEAIQNKEICGEFNKYDREYNCCKDCNKLKLEYFRYEFSASLFGASIRNCYCEGNNTTIQIW